MYLAIDIGGTNTRIAISSDLEEIQAVEKFKTIKEFSSFIGNIEIACKKLTEGRGSLNSIKGISVGIAGSLSEDGGIMLHSPNLPFLNNISIRSFFPWISNEVRVISHNDALLSALGEAVYGSGSQYRSVAYVSLGTGVGGALIVNKQLDPYRSTFEPGHQIIAFRDKFKDGSYIAGTVETFLSGKGFFRVHRKNPHECKDPRVWYKYGEILGVLAINIVCMWNPDVIVIGGGMSDHFDEFIQGAIDKLESTYLTNKPPIVKNTFGEGSALIAGFHLLKGI